VQQRPNLAPHSSYKILCASFFCLLRHLCGTFIAISQLYACERRRRRWRLRMCAAMSKSKMLLLLLSRVKRQVQKYSNEKRLPATILCTLISPLLPPLIESVIARALLGMRHASATHTHSTPCLYKINGRRARALVLLHFFSSRSSLN
jgi:hypothetical protein